MKLLLLTPAPEGSLAGNRATAERWAGLLEKAGHRVKIATNYDSELADAADLLIALHAWRSHEAIASWRRAQGNKPLIVALTGTDLYRFQYTHPDETRPAMAAADGLIVLHELAWRDVPEDLQDRITVVLQSARAADPQPPQEDQQHFDVCVIGHLREEKDPLATARAAGLLPSASCLRVLHAGKAHDSDWEQAALDEMAANPRYHWLGEISREQTRNLLASSRAMVISSIMEGGANVVSEACRAGLPVIASDIPGNLGLLGEHYPGQYPVGDVRRLSELLERAENDAEWLATLGTIVSDLAGRFTPEREQASLEEALRRVSP
ncbi:putative glycosyltransferase, TIGR04348 family [Marinobacter daqiaonensis]|uniref:Putative glycosyltransferase, TIGR04348 family n=1 Tax=Marinobacter daqiaonensis TaxID=650891 RepID=A0A1I6GS48_9GAMM|nr:selenoneine biosynthesis selenosugar synthase SenB [Marinobacter daqiaonensis]SFR45008.1 putative glycosyltransferase, TIGR04348 family [Marinobacter daqiaonensis]